MQQHMMRWVQARLLVDGLPGMVEQRSHLQMVRSNHDRGRYKYRKTLKSQGPSPLNIQRRGEAVYLVAHLRTINSV